jgi:hypothetical protein
MSELVDDAIFEYEYGYPVFCPNCREWFNSFNDPCPNCNWPDKKSEKPTMDLLTVRKLLIMALWREVKERCLNPK